MAENSANYSVLTRNLLRQKLSIPSWILGLKTLVIEFIGTFFFVLIASCTKINPIPAISIGFGLTSLVYLFGPMGGGIVNPAVTMALMIRGKLTPKLGFAVIFVQLFAGVIAGGITYGLYSSKWEFVGKKK
jgi:aquaporin Z